MRWGDFWQSWFKWLAYSPEEMLYHAPKITLIGGGSGLARLLQGLKQYTYNLSAIVTVFDSGGHTGKLRKDLKVPAVGDLRNCLVALSEEEDLMREFFDFRFQRGRYLNGYSFGNLFLAMLLEMARDLDQATQIASALLKVKGKVIPSSLGNAHLWAELKNGEKVKGEAEIPEAVVRFKSPIKKIWLEPPQKINPKAVRAIKESDLIVIGPGSLFTSILPNFLVAGLKEAFNKAKVKKIYVVNVSQERGETMGFSVEDHLDWLLEMGIEIDLALVNSRILKKDEDIVRLGGVRNISTTKKKYKNIKICRADLIDLQNPLYHQPKKLARKIIELIQ